MPPKKRKIEAEAKEEASGESLDAADIEVKKEALSQEDVKDGGGDGPQGEGKVGRNLRPRKSTCYAEKESPEIQYEEKQKKGPRRKRRPASSQDGFEEKESKIKRIEKGSEGLATPSSGHATPCDADNNLRSPTLVSCSGLNFEHDTKQKDNSATTAVTGTEDNEESKQSTEKKRPRKKKPKPKVNEVLPIDPDIVPKTEPVSPSALPKNAKNQEDAADGDQADPVPVAAKPKPRKRIRNKKPAATAAADGKPKEDETIIKQEVDENEGDSGKKTNLGENEEGKEGEEKAKPSVAPRKRPAKKKARPAMKKEPVQTEAEGEINNDGSVEKEIKTEAVDDEQQNDPIGSQKAAPPAKKRIKSRPKKPTTNIKNTAENGDEGKSEETTKIEETREKKKASGKADGEPVVKAQAPAARKPFFRGRRSKSISARSGRKEITHTEEAIDPEDIRGFEHVEKFVTPVGVKLPKFWDSEDEMSEDENNDNFRRIMCGFGTNCRIHEVIRPASEIVRRLKELQNTFGATKSLPLFQKDDLESIEDPPISTCADPLFRRDRDRNITWHTDPSFFKYANNYPSKCK